jgi:hypothetical protein
MVPFRKPAQQKRQLHSRSFSDVGILIPRHPGVQQRK